MFLAGHGAQRKTGSDTTGPDINDPTDNHKLKALPGRIPGLHLLTMYTAFRQINPAMDTGADFGAKHEAATEMQKT